MLGDFASLDVQNTYRGSDAYDLLSYISWMTLQYFLSSKIAFHFWCVISLFLNFEEESSYIIVI
ncbi:hypothetical protein [Piscirickettsia salmonis]|uniref:hypothetical protein n=1 Tax=Piscirickettsia salmonis TaxID=1238 RepID=UPI000A582B0A|nr:hypothetical protein [Piscirickettsia salmonis]QNR80077.1 hypothetical protein ICC15_14130 [Piscirickettsia salmonis]